jgi:hypothetical protein
MADEAVPIFSSHNPYVGVRYSKVHTFCSLQNYHNTKILSHFMKQMPYDYS